MTVGCLGNLVVLERERPQERAVDGGLVVDDQYSCLLGHFSDSVADRPATVVLSQSSERMPL